MKSVTFYNLVGKHLSAVNQIQQDHLNERIETADAQLLVGELLDQLKTALAETPPPPVAG